MTVEIHLTRKNWHERFVQKIPSGKASDWAPSLNRNLDKCNIIVHNCSLIEIWMDFNFLNMGYSTSFFRLRHGLKCCSIMPSKIKLIIFWIQIVNWRKVTLMSNTMSSSHQPSFTNYCCPADENSCPLALLNHHGPRMTMRLCLRSSNDFLNLPSGCFSAFRADWKTRILSTFKNSFI